MAPSKKHSKAKATTAKQPSRTSAPPHPPPQPIPSWPELKPAMPLSDLSLTTLLDDQIIVIRKFWTSSLCRKYVSFLNSLPLTTTPGLPKKGEALRVNDRFEIMDPNFADRLWNQTGLSELVHGTEVDDGGVEERDSIPKERRALWGGEAVGLNPRIRIYRYSKGQFFDCHYDESNVLNLTSPDSRSIPVRTTWTMLLYLTSSTEGCIGGETVFYPDDIIRKGKAQIDKEFVVSLETGMLLLHKHGNDCMLHEGREVTAGEKWVIRSDLCVRR